MNIGFMQRAKKQANVNYAPLWNVILLRNTENNERTVSIDMLWIEMNLLSWDFNCIASLEWYEDSNLLIFCGCVALKDEV